MTTSVFPGELSRGLHEAGSDVRRSHLPTRSGPPLQRITFAKGVWQRFETIHPEQPQDGFTVSIDEDPAEIALLCEAWEIAASSHRQMIREVARISVSNEAGIPARRYDP